MHMYFQNQLSIITKKIDKAFATNHFITIFLGGGISFNDSIPRAFNNLRPFLTNRSLFKRIISDVGCGHQNSNWQNLRKFNNFFFSSAMILLSTIIGQKQKGEIGNLFHLFMCQQTYFVYITMHNNKYKEISFHSILGSLSISSFYKICAGKYVTKI